MDECKNCRRRFKILTKEGICYYCFTSKYGRSPTLEYGNKFTNKSK